MSNTIRLDRNYEVISRGRNSYSDSFGVFVDDVIKQHEAGSIAKDDVALLLNIAIRTGVGSEAANVLNTFIGGSRPVSEKRTMFMQLTNTTKLSHA